MVDTMNGVDLAHVAHHVAEEPNNEPENVAALHQLRVEGVVLFLALHIRQETAAPMHALVRLRF